MNTDEIDAHAAGLERVGVALSQDWRSADERVTAGLGAIGTNELLSQTFRTTHDADAFRARAEADRLLGVYAVLAAAGRDSAAGYLTANATAEQGMPRARFN
jgi:hypothetical protein